MSFVCSVWLSWVVGVLCVLSTSAWLHPPPTHGVKPALPLRNVRRHALGFMRMSAARGSETSSGKKREGWMESDSTTIMGRSRTPASDAGSQEDDYTVLDLEVTARMLKDLKLRRAELGIGSRQEEHVDSNDPEDIARAGFVEQSARRSQSAERLFLAALEKSMKCGAAWYGLGSLLHECQHGGLAASEGVPENDRRAMLLRQAADAALIAARFEPKHPRALALLGDVLNDLGNHREACRAWTAAETRGRGHWKLVTAPWSLSEDLDAFGPREPLRSLRTGDAPVVLQRASNGRSFTAHRVADVPHAFVLEGFSTAEERDQIVAAALLAPMRAVPRANDG